MFYYILFIITLFSTLSADVLPSWNDGPAKQAIIDFVKRTTEPSSKDFVPPEERIATFDQDGTLWVEQPLYTQVVFSFDRLKEVVKTRPELKSIEPFKTILTGDYKLISKLPLSDLEKIMVVTLTNISVEDYNAAVKQWLETAKHPRWNKPYTDLTYQPMQELLRYLRDNGYKTFIITGGGQDFVRNYSNRVYGIPSEQVVGTAGKTMYEYNNGKPVLIKEPKLLLNDDFAGKPEGIQFMIGRRPQAAFGNSIGDQQMLEYTGGGDGAHLMMLVLHDDAQREFAYGPAQGLPDSKVGAFSQALYDEAKQNGWFVISMKNDWKKIFSFEK